MTRRRFVIVGAYAAGGVLIRRGLASEKTPEGRVEVCCRFDGDPPEPRILDCSEDPYCAKRYRKEPLRDESLLVGREGALRNVFVVVRKGLPKGRSWPPPAEPVVVDQDCVFIPHVIGVQVGQPLEFRNSARTLEVPHGYPVRNKEFSFNLPEKTSARVVFEFPETFHLECDVHPWELGFCHVVEHPFFAVTDVQGRALLTGLPPGTYELEFWHEKLGVQKRTVTIERGAALRLDDVVFRKRRRRRSRAPSSSAPSPPPASQADLRGGT